MDKIRRSGKRHIKANYLRRRFETEDWLIAERTRLLGATPRQRPIYFFLGDFADGRDPSRPCSIVIPLAELPPEIITFTFPDSMASLPLAHRRELRAFRKPHHGQVFTRSDVEQLIRRIGLLHGRAMTEVEAKYDRFFEVQVWDDGPFRPYVRQ